MGSLSVNAGGPSGALARVRAEVGRSWPMWLVAFSLNGFFLYLAALDAVDVGPTTPITAAYYGLVCTALLATAWIRREAIETRLRAGRRLVAVCVGAAAVLAAWFLVNTALLSDGPLGRRLAGLLVLWSLPTALVALSLRRDEIPRVAEGLVALALVFVPIEAWAAVRAGGDVFRFSPIADLDVISAGLIPALGAVAALSLQTSSRWGRAAQLAIVVVLVAAAVVPGSRGPILALIVAALAMALVRPSPATVVTLATLAAGLAVGSTIGSQVGSFGYLATGQDEEISTLSIRRQWLEDALEETPDRPLFGHGVGMFEDRTPEARQMGVEGQRTYPHNTFVEAAHALGVVGLVAFVAFVGAAVLALVRVVRRRGRDPAVAFAVGIGALAFANTNVSGEIGSDALLWAAAALALALYEEPRERADILRR